MNAKKKKRAKRLVTDNIAVSEVVGTALLLSVTIPICTIVSIGIANFGMSQREMLDKQVEMIQSEINVIEQFIDYLNSLGFNTSCDNSTNGTCPPPDVEYFWNYTTSDWDVYLWWPEHYLWIKIYPPVLDGEGVPIYPPNPPDGEGGSTPSE